MLEFGELRQFLVDLWRRTRIDWSFAGELHKALRTEVAPALRATMNGKTRRWSGDVIFGMIRQLRRIDEALKAGGVRANASAPDELRVIAYLMLDGQLSPRDAVQHSPSAAVSAVDWERVTSIDRTIDSLKPAWRRLALKCSFPDWLAKRLVADLGQDALAFGEAVNRRGPMCVRVNSLVATVDEVEAAFAAAGIESTRGSYASAALRIGGHRDVTALAAYRDGAFELQDEASQVVAELAFAPGVEALTGQLAAAKPLLVDYCAGAGGKVLAWAGRLGNHGRLVACDTDPRKLAELRKRARRARVSTVHTVELGESGHRVTDELRASAPCVLVDAPCSGLGALRRHPETRWRITAAQIDELARRQADILSVAAELVAPGGVLIYATCTVLAAENQRVVDTFLSRHKDFSLLPLRDAWPERAAAIADPSGDYLFMTPHRHDTDGFFAAILQRAP